MLSLPSAAKGAATVQPTTLPTSASDRLPSLQAKGNDGAVVQLTSNRPATQSPVGELQTPVSGVVVNPARVERNRNTRAPAPSLSTSSVSPSLRTGSASPVSALPQIPDNTSVPPSPASANLTSQGRNFQSISPQVGVAQVSPPQSVPTPQIKTPVQTSVSVPLISTSSGQNEPRPPRRRQSSGLDFLQLDLQVARQKKLMAAKLASKAQKSESTQASPGVVPSPLTKDSPATATVSPTSTTTAGIPNIPVAPTSTPTVPAAAQVIPARTPETAQATISAIITSVQNIASQPQTTSPTLVHRDLRQGSSRVRTSGASPRKLRITDRAPAPAPELGSSCAPIIIDEEEVSPMGEPMEVDAPMQPRTSTEETPMALDSDAQNMQGGNGDEKDDPKPQRDRERQALPEQQASLHDKPSGAQFEQTMDRGKVAEDPVEDLGLSNNDIGSGATIVPSLGNELSPVLSKDSTHTALGVISAPKDKDTEMTPPAPTTTSSTAVATESPAAPDHSTISAQSVVVGSSNSSIITLDVRPQEKEGSSDTSVTSVDPSLPMRQAASQTPSISGGKASVSTPLGLPVAPHPSTESLSDMDISFTSDIPPIVVLGTSPSHSRSTSPQSGKRSSEGASEMVDELAPLFGKEMKVVCMDRVYDVPGEFTWDFTLSHADWDKVSQWVKAPENLEYVSHPSLSPSESNRLILNFVL